MKLARNVPPSSPVTVTAPQKAISGAQKGVAPAITTTQSYEEAQVSFFPYVAAIEPSRSFGNLMNYLRGQKEEEKQSQDIMSQYFSSSHWNESIDESDRTSRSTQSAPAGAGTGTGLIDFACGLSGHSGLNKGPTRYTNAPRTRSVMRRSQY